MAKYSLTENTREINGVTLYQIKAEENNYIHAVAKGELGGWVETGFTLSQQGSCWIGADSIVYDGSKVSDDVLVTGKSKIFDGSSLNGRGRIENCEITDTFLSGRFAVENSKIKDVKMMCDDVSVYYSIIEHMEATDSIEKFKCFNAKLRFELSGELVRGEFTLHHTILSVRKCKLTGNVFMENVDLDLGINCFIYGDSTLQNVTATNKSRFSLDTVDFIGTDKDEPILFDGGDFFINESKITGSVYQKGFIMMEKTVLKDDAQIINDESSALSLKNIQVQDSAVIHRLKDSRLNAILQDKVVTGDFVLNV